MRRRKKTEAAAVICMMAGLLFMGQEKIYAADDGLRQNVWIDVVKKDYSPRISVTVPTTFAFVVNGTRDTDNRVEISVDKGTLLLPNVVVNVLDHSSGTSDYEIAVVGDSKMYVRNYSTETAEKDGDGNENYDPSLRQGKAVQLEAYIENSEGLAAKRGCWRPAAEDSAVTAEEENRKNYRISLEDSAHQYVFKKEDKTEKKIWADQKIALDKPDESGGYTVSGTAKDPFELELKLDVEIGGYRGQYTQVEESVKAGKIIWQVDIR